VRIHMRRTGPRDGRHTPAVPGVPDGHDTPEEHDVQQETDFETRRMLRFSGYGELPSYALNVHIISI